jgi:hypothetical protein
VTTSADSSDVDRFVALERRVWDALVSGDADADRDCLAEHFLGVYPSGVGDRDTHAAQLAEGPTVADYEIVDPRIVPVAPGHVLLVYLARYRRPGDDQITDQMFVSSIWSSIDGRWSNVFSQDTPVGGAESVV